MKPSIFFAVVFALIACLIPMLALRGGGAGVPPAVHSPAPAASVSETPYAPPASREAKPGGAVTSEAPQSPAAPREENLPGGYSGYGVLSFKILDQSTGEVNELSVRDYVRGAVASEMPASFHPEALKAQAVAAHTYALYNHYLQERSPDPALLGADFSADPSNRAGYMTEETAREFYGGESADFYWAKICDAVDAVLPYVLEYDGEPIVAAYHAISAGRTEAAGNVWEGGVPYLVPAESEGCLLAPDYEVTVSVSAGNVRETLLGAYPEMELSGGPAGWFGAGTRSVSGYLTEIEVGGVPLHGKVIRELFGLRSHHIKIALEGEAFLFTAYGYGHGVGLSQYGADFMARQGAGYDEILRNYYTGIVIREVDFEALRQK